jgi:uncharacterized membrane protein (UPF0127 family)
MKLRIQHPCLLLALVAGAGCNKTNPMSNADNLAAATNPATAQVSIEDILPKQAQPKLPTIKLWVGAEELETEMALTSEQMMAGMMWRTNMPENTAMIFVSPRAGRASYWMKNCYVPLSIAYIDVEGVILEIYDMQPMKTNAVPSASFNVQFALETPQGWFQRHKINPGAVVRTERGSLAETFLRR